MNSRITSLIKGTSALVFVVIIFVAVIVKAQLSGYEILKTDMSARASGMSGAFVGVYGDLHSLFYNPAGLNGISERSFSFTFLDHIVDIKSGSFVFAAPRGVKGKYAIGINYINYGTFEGRDINGLPAPSFNAQDIAVSGAYAGEYSPSIFYGISSTFLYSKIAGYSSTVFAIGGGFIYSVPKQKLTIGLSAENIGYAASAFSKTKDRVPAVIKGGFSKQLAHLPLLINFEVRQYIDGEFQMVGGGEFAFTDAFIGRLGYNSYGPDQKIGDEGSILAGVSFGFGVNWRNYVFDYSYSSFGVIGNLQRLTVSMNM